MTENAKTKAVKVAAVMTAPRHEITAARNQISNALSRAGIPLTVSGGVFYGQCMQIMLEELIEADTDYAVTVDFDSFFTHEHVSRLISQAVHNEKIDAVCAMQAKRGKPDLLGTNGNPGTFQTNGQPFELHTAHFGLTVIDLRKLAIVPKPWFWCKPADDGTWSKNKVDDDIYFWRQWREAGNSIYCDPEVRIGHMEEMVTEFVERDGAFVVDYAYPKDWRERHGY